MNTLIHKRRSPLPTGTVTLDDCTIIGQVERQSRIAAGGDARTRKVFYAARVCVPMAFEDLAEPKKLWRAPWVAGRAYVYLGTRYITQAQALAVVRDFHAQHPEGFARHHLWQLALAWTTARAHLFPFNGGRIVGRDNLVTCHGGATVVA
jgi:hypothetical protein